MAANPNIPSEFDRLYNVILLACGSTGKIDATNKFVAEDKKSYAKPILEKCWEGYLFASYIDELYKSLKHDEQQRFKKAVGRVVRNVFKGAEKKYTLKNINETPRDSTGFPKGKPQSLLEELAKEFDWDLLNLFQGFLKQCEGSAISSFYQIPSPDNEETRKISKQAAADKLSEVIFDLEEYVEKRGPYKGLAHFTENDRKYFYGRDKEAQALYRQILDNPFTAVVGASGCGKSSIVFAGVLPKFRDDGNWIIIETRLGHGFNRHYDPFKTLASSLVQSYSSQDNLPQESNEKKEVSKLLKNGGFLDCLESISQKFEGKKTLIIIDQFEEIFTLKIEEEVREEFFDFLVSTAEILENNHSASIVINLRWDFFNRLEPYPVFIKLVRDNENKLNILSDEKKLIEVIEKPALENGVKFENGLVQTILRNAAKSGYNLSLTEFALRELWNNQEKGVLTYAAYEKMGRIAGALTKQAEKIIENLGKSELELARKTFINLVNHGENGSPDVKRVVKQEDFDDPEQWHFAQKLANESHRLLVIKKYGEEITIELIHDKLITEWDSLKNWIDESREFAIWQKKFQIGVDEWLKHSKNNDYLLIGEKLKEAQERAFNDELTAAQDDFIKESTIYYAKSIRKKRFLKGALLVFLLIFVILSVFLYSSIEVISTQKDAVVKERDIALTNRNIILSNKAEEFAGNSKNRLAAILALESIRGNDKNEEYVKNSIKTLKDLSGRYIEVRRIPTMRATAALAFSPDAKFIAIGGVDKKVLIWDVVSGSKPIVTFDVEHPISELLYEQNGNIVLAKSLSGETTKYDLNAKKSTREKRNEKSKEINENIFEQWKRIRLKKVFSGFGLISPYYPEGSAEHFDKNAHYDFDWRFLKDEQENVSAYAKNNDTLGFLGDGGVRIFKKIEFPIEYSTVYGVNKSFDVSSISGNFEFVALFLPDNAIEVRWVKNNSLVRIIKSSTSLGAISSFQLNQSGEKILVSYAKGKLVEWDVRSGGMTEIFSNQVGSLGEGIYSNDQKHALVANRITHSDEFSDYYQYFEIDINKKKRIKKNVSSSMRSDRYSATLFSEIFPNYSQTVTDRISQSVNIGEFQKIFVKSRYKNFGAETVNLSELDGLNSNRGDSRVINGIDTGIKVGIMLNRKDGQSYRVKTNSNDVVRHMFFSPNEEYLLVQNEDDIAIYSTKDGALTRRFSFDEKKIDRVILLEDSRSMAVQLNQSQLLVYDLRTGNVNFRYTSPNKLCFLAASHDSRKIAWLEGEKRCGTRRYPIYSLNEYYGRDFTRIVISPIKILDDSNIVDYFNAFDFPPIQRYEIDDLIFRLYSQ